MSTTRQKQERGKAALLQQFNRLVKALQASTLITHEENKRIKQIYDHALQRYINNEIIIENVSVPENSEES